MASVGVVGPIPTPPPSIYGLRESNGIGWHDGACPRVYVSFLFPKNLRIYNFLVSEKDVMGGVDHVYGIGWDDMIVCVLECVCRLPFPKNMGTYTF